MLQRERNIFIIQRKIHILHRGAKRLEHFTTSIRSMQEFINMLLPAAYSFRHGLQSNSGDDLLTV